MEIRYLRLLLTGSAASNTPETAAQEKVSELSVTVYAHDATVHTATAVSDYQLSDKRSGVFKAGCHAVFLDNGQVYFGKLMPITEGQRFATLRRIYYLSDTEGQVSGDALNFSLIKLGGELHGPTDEMRINVMHILFWEKLRDDGPVGKAIAAYESRKTIT